MFSAFLYFVIAFIGYTIGRITHIHWGYIKSPHHWIYGLLLIIIGGYFHETALGQASFAFGCGHFISDFKDFLNFKVYGVDPSGPKRFWGID